MSLDRRSFLGAAALAGRAADAVCAGRNRAALHLHHPARRGGWPEHRHPLRGAGLCRRCAARWPSTRRAR